MNEREILGRLREAKIGEQPFSRFLPNSPAVRNIGEAQTIFKILTGIPGYGNRQEQIDASILFRTTRQSIDIPNAEWKELSELLGQYDAELRGLRRYLDAKLASAPPETIYIKLPPSSNLREFANDTTRIEKALAQLVHIPSIDGRLELQGCEEGSVWLKVFTGGVAVVSVIGTAAWAGAVVYKKLQEAKMHAEMTRGLELKNDMLEAFVEAQKKSLNNLVEGEARALADAHLPGEVTPDNLERIKHTIRELAEAIERGAEIHPSLQQPESVRNLFPDFSNLLQIQSRIPMLHGGAKPEARTGTDA